MMLVGKNKGMLVVVYLIVCFIGTAILVGVLHRNYGGIFSEIDFYTTAGISLLLAALWTWLTKDDYYKDKEGNKVKVNISNEFFWINMKVWAFIYLGGAVVLLGNLLFHYFRPAA